MFLGGSLSGRLTSATLKKKTSSVSSPRHADSPTPVSSEASFSSSDSEAEMKDTVGFMRKFLSDKQQDMFEKLKFLDCVDIINTTSDREKRDGFGDYLGNQTLLRDTLKFLLSETASPKAQEREVAIARITKLICFITSHCVTKGMKNFKIGQVAGCLTLCCTDPSENVRQWVADGLHNLYTLLQHQKRLTKAQYDLEYLELLQEWEEEKIFWLAWFSDVSNATMIFKKSLRVHDQMDFMMIAVQAMRDDDRHNTKTACLMLKAMLRNPHPSFVKVSKTITFLHYNLEHISYPKARQVVLHFLYLLGESHPQEVVKALLACSLQCDSSASIMWHVLTAYVNPAQKVLEALQRILQNRPFRVTHPGMKQDMGPLAASAALYEVLRSPSPACKEVLKAMYPTLAVSLLCNISYTMNFTPKDIHTFWSACIDQETPTPTLPFRSAMRNFKALIRRLSDGEQALIMNERRGCELLSHHSSFQKGLMLFARVLLRNKMCEQMLPCLLDILHTKEETVCVIAMTFVVQILDKQILAEPMEDVLIQQLCIQLKARTAELRSLSLSGMLCLADSPKKMAKLKPALIDILARLKEANREINMKALKVLSYLLRSLESEELDVADVAAQVIPLFDDGSNKVRLAAISTFNCLLDITKRNNKDLMKQFTMESLVPLMVHLQDESTPVAQACWTSLRKVDHFMKSFIQLSINENEPWTFCTSLVKRYREHGESILLEQAFSYLENPRHSLREGAIKLLEIMAQTTKHKETVTAITTVLNLVHLEAKPSDICLVASEIIETIGRDSRENLLGSCFNGIKRMCRR